MHYNQLMKEEIKEKTGEKYEQGRRYSRWGSNPGSIRIGEEKIRVEIPRFYDKEEKRTEETSYYKLLHKIPKSNEMKPSEIILKKIIKGLSQRDYEEVTGSVLESFGIS